MFPISWPKKTILKFGNNIIQIHCYAEVISVIIVKESSKVFKEQDSSLENW